MLGLTLLSGVIAARALGPNGRGVYGVAVVIIGIGVQVASLGFNASTIYLGAKYPDRFPGLLGNSAVVSLALGGLAATVAIVVGMLWPGLISLPGPTLILAAFGIPVGLTFLLCQSLLLASRDIRRFNLADIANKAATVLLMCAFVVGGLTSPNTFLFSGIVAGSCVAAWMFVSLRRRVGSLIIDRGLFVEGVSYAGRAYLASLFAFLMLRVDLLLVEHLLGSEDAGQYAVAVSLADVVYMFPLVVGTLLFPALTSIDSPASRRAVARRAGLVAIAITAVIAVIAALGADFVIALLFGSEFLNAAPLFRLLLPGVTCLAATSVLSAYIASFYIPRYVPVVYLVTLLFNLALNAALLPTWGVEFASICSSVSYALTLVLLLGATRRHFRRASSA
jgi:O-antigen/teichoic acid export membrane protein